MSGRGSQSTNKPIGRSGFSTNWRVKDDASLNQAVRGPETVQPRWSRPTSTGKHNNRKPISNESSPRLEATPDDRARQATQEGRRLYVGNLPYMAKEDDVTALFPEDHYKLEHISMSSDPFTGRNPSYCFVDLQDKGQADQAIQELNGLKVLGRPVRIRPGVPKSQRPGPNIFDRWERQDAADHWKGYSDEGRRLWVGGLPRMSSDYDVEKGVREFFYGFAVECVSKIIIPRTQDRINPEKRGWNDRYLFVDFATPDEAESARKARNGVLSWGVEVRVAKARGNSWKPDERLMYQVDQ